jgi:hypothetical protein
MQQGILIDLPPAMGVRWQRYKSGHRDKPVIRLKAVLVESTHGGKPRYVAFIASTDLSDRCRFWREARKRLDRLGDRITPEERATIDARLAAKVGEPSG